MMITNLSPQLEALHSRIVKSVELARDLTKESDCAKLVSSYPDNIPVRFVSNKPETTPVAPIYMGTLGVARSLLLDEYKGVAGVYILYRVNNPNQFYVGSSVNLGLRMVDYYQLTVNQVPGRTTVERAFNGSGNPEDWGVIFVGFYPQSLWLWNSFL